MFLSDGEVTFLANHTLNGEILRSAECGAVDVKFFVLAEKGVIIVSLIFDGELKGDKNTCALSIILPQTELAFYLPLHTICVERLKHVIRKGRIWMQKGYNIISVLSLEIIPIMELLASMKSHHVPEDIDIKDTVLNDDDIGDSCHEDFLHKAVSSHLQTCGCSIVVGSNPEKVNKIVRTLCLFLTPAERKCSRLCKADSSFKYDTGLFVQGLLKDSTGSFVLPFRQVLYSPYPTTHIDVDINTVKQMPPCHEHTYNQRRYMRSELSALWKTDSEDDIPPETVIHTDETFTPDLNIFQDVMHKDTLVKSFIDEVFLTTTATYFSQGVHAEAGPVPAEHLSGPVPAAAPQEGPHIAQVHRGRNAEREEAVSIPAQPKDRPGSDGGGGPAHRNGLRREAEGGTALVRVQQAVLHQHARARRSHDLLTYSSSRTFMYRTLNGSRCLCFLMCYINACTSEYVFVLCWNEEKHVVS
ncbi:guanine nucleotide exchange C9orf72 homolog isoform X2 [Gymnodraco acuticeps]|nr:guanine nucleotide exchange C9orf72 homolog isoform X2 [Gymnodraco acuticeps]